MRKRVSRALVGSGDFRSDWQYLIAASRMSTALSLATLFSVVALIRKFSDLVNLGRPALYCFLAAATCYFGAIVVIRLAAPRFLQEYPDYKTFEDKKHSHRWILWLLHDGLSELRSGPILLLETVEKGLSLEESTLPLPSDLPIASAFGGAATMSDIEETLSDGSKASTQVGYHKPQNFGRDLILGFTIRSSANNVVERYVLPLREDDPKREEKSRELFWIILTAAAKENVGWRRLAWFALRLALLLLASAAILAVLHALLAPETTTMPFSFRYV